MNNIFGIQLFSVDVGDFLERLGFHYYKTGQEASSVLPLVMRIGF